MSAIDDRVVRMEFDNKQFETGVSETMSSLQKLKAALNLRGSDKGIENIQNAANQLNFGSVNDQIQQVQQRFSFFGEFVRNIFDRISNKIIDLGSTMAKSLTTDPLRDGFNEYELQMNSVQTIMASTGKSIDTVNGYLDELNTYADKTIYSFSDMTANIGKFTNAGVELDDAVAAIQGISNEAALSGANAAEASRAMYNFSQALSAGAVKLVDWKSIENANMATKGFKEQLIDTAVALGTVKKTENGYVSTTKDLQGKVSDAFTSTKGFNESLSAQWMTTEVLTETLKHYSTDVRTMTKEERKAYTDRLRGLGFNDEQIKKIKELGKQAFDSAQDVKTFSQLIDTVKESLGSGWTKSFQYMIGDLEEAKVLWTGVNKQINAVLDPIAKAREEMLKFWHDNGGRKAAIRAISNTWKGLKSIMGAVATAYRNVFPPLTGEKLVQITKNIRNLTKNFREFATSDATVARIQKIFMGVFGAFKLLIDYSRRFLLHFAPVMRVIGTFGTAMFQVAARLGSFIYGIASAEKPLVALRWRLDILKNIAGEAVKAFEDLVVSLLDLVGIHIDGNPITDLFNTLTKFMSEHFDFSAFKGLGSASAIARAAVSGLADALSKILNFGVGGLKAVVGKITGAFKSLGTGSKEATDSMKPLANIELPSIQTVLGAFGNFIVKVAKKVAGAASTIAEKIPEAFEYLGSYDFAATISNVNKLLTGGVLLSIKKFIDSYTKKDGSVDAGGIFKSIKNAIDGIDEKAGGVFDNLSNTLNRFQENVQSGTLIKISIAVGLLAASITRLGTLDAEKTATGIAAIAACLGMLSTSLNSLSTSNGAVAAVAVSQMGSALIKMAVAVGVLTLAIKMLSGVNMEQLETGFTGIMGLLIALVSSMTLLTRFGGNVGKTSKGLISLAISIGILSMAVKSLASLKPKQLERGLKGVASLLFSIGIFAAILDGGGLSLKTAFAILVTAGALKALQGVVTTFASLKPKQLERGLKGVAGLLVALWLFSSLLEGGGLSIKTAVTILMTVGALKALEGTVTTFAALKPKQLERGLKGVVGLLVAVGIFSALLGNTGLTLKAAVSIAILSVAIGALTSVVTSFGGMSADQMENALHGLAASMIIMVGALMVLSASSGMMLVGSAALLVMSFAVGVLVPALQELAKVPALDIAKAVGGITLALIGMGVGLAVLGLAAPLALLASLAFVALGAAAGYLGIGLTTLAGGMTAFAAAVAASATGFLSGVSMIVSGIGALLAGIVVGIGEAIIGFVVSIASGIDQILGAISTIIHAVGNFIIQNIPYILGVVTTLISSVLTLGIQFIPQIASLITQFVVTVITTIITFIPTIASVLVTGTVTLVNAVANGIRDNAESILAAVRNILSSVLELILTALGDLLGMIPGVGGMLAEQMDHAKEAVQQTLAPETLESYTTDAMGGAISGVEKGGTEMAAAADEASAAAKESIAENLTGGAELSGKFMTDLVSSFTSANGDLTAAGGENFDAYMSKFLDTGEAGDISSTLNSTMAEELGANPDLFATSGDVDVNAFLESFKTDASDKSGIELASKAAAGTTGGAILTKFKNAAKTDGKAFGTGLSGYSVSSAGKTMAATGASGASELKGAYQNTGTSMVTGFSWGMLSPYALSLARQAGVKVANTSLAAVKDTIKSKSPSREAMKLGKFFTQGYAIGIGSLSKAVYDEAANMGFNSLDGIKNSLQTMSKYIDADIDVDPTIRPVLDLTDIQNGITTMNGMFNRADESLTVGFGDSTYANGLVGSLLASRNTGFGSSGMSDALNASAKTVNVTVNLQYDASADANDLARGFARAVQPYVVRGE